MVGPCSSLTERGTIEHRTMTTRQHRGWRFLTKRTTCLAFSTAVGSRVHFRRLLSSIQVGPVGEQHTAVYAYNLDYNNTITTHTHPPQSDSTTYYAYVCQSKNETYRNHIYKLRISVIYSYIPSEDLHTNYDILRRIKK